MKKTKKVKETKEVTQVVDYICNMCGLTLSNAKRKGYKNHLDYSGLEELEVHGGYDSERIGDMCGIRFSLCEHCLVDNILPMFKIQPEYKTDYLPWMSKDKMNKAEIKLERDMVKEWVKTIKTAFPKIKRETLKNKTTHELYDIFHNARKEIKENEKA
jgi:hypothetical protein